jgi:hypothetical protein
MRCNSPLPLLLLMALTAVASPVRAQSGQQPSRGPDSSTQTRVPGIDVLPLPGMPFTGSDRTVWTRPLAGGGSTTSYLQAKAIRDGQGRLYRERHFFSTADADPATTLHEFSILDPVAHTATVCEPVTHFCHITAYRPQLSFAVQPVGPFDKGRRYLTRESLGNQWIENLAVTGTLETVAVAPGTLGNDQSLAITREFWYSPDLQTNLTVIRNDPREGKQEIHLLLDSRAEPEPSVFAIPAGYRVQDDRGPIRSATAALQQP